MLSRSLTLVALLVFVGCAAEDVPPAVRGGAGGAADAGAVAMMDAGRADAAASGAGGAQGGVQGAGGSPGMGGAPGAGGALGMGGQPGMGGVSGAGGMVVAEVPYCSTPAYFHWSTNGCGFLIRPGEQEFLWKDGMACGACEANGKSFTGCKVDRQPEDISVGDQPTLVLCVSNCRAECCYKRPGAPCETDANCCAPLRCIQREPGKNKTCD